MPYINKQETSSWRIHRHAAQKLISYADLASLACFLIKYLHSPYFFYLAEQDYLWITFMFKLL